MEEEKSIMNPDAIMTAIGKTPISQELTVDQVVNQVNKVKELMQKVMRDGEHYGVIPGTKKPTLYKSGAEKLGTLFRIRPEYKTEIKYLENSHREYQITCNLIHLQTGNIVGQGMGSCSTLESKYRYRHKDEVIEQVPAQYWDNKDQALIGEGNRAKKINGQWMVVRSGDRIENPDIADCYNTCWKIGAKRAHVASMLTACAASDIFTQDLEDFQGKQELTAEVVKEKPIAGSPKDDGMVDYIEKSDQKKRGRLSKEEILKRSESVTQLMLDNATITQKEFDQIAKHTADIADDYKQLFDSYKALCQKYKEALHKAEGKQIKNIMEEPKEIDPNPFPADPDPDFNQDLPGGIF